MLATMHAAGAIVIVDDEPHVGAMLGRIVRDIAPAYHIVVAQHGAEVLLQVQSRPVTLVITDYQIEDVDGVEITRAVKRRSPHTSVLALTDEPDSRVRQAFYAAGVNFYLCRPIALSLLTRVVHQSLDPGLERSVG